jgi:hypothetical protein
MNNRLSIFLVTFATALAAGCSSHRLLVGENLDVGENPDASDPEGGVTGPLPISARDALIRIAAVLWQGAPDGDLLAQATQGQITTIDELRSVVVDQMLVDPRAANGVGAFYRWWLNLPALATSSKDTSLFPVYTSGLRDDMAAETETFGVNVTLALSGSYQTLLTADFSFINERLAGIYGVSGVSGDALRMVALPAQARAGLLTQPALQALSSDATRNSPPRRGAYVAERFLCNRILQPPVNPSDTPLDTSTPGITLRKAIEDNEQQSATCLACHHLFDPAGFAFEGFDAVGRARTTDNGAPVDVSDLSITLSASRPPTVVDGPIELANLLANEPAAHDCMSRKWLTFVLGRDLRPADDPSLAQIGATFSAAGYNLEALIAAVLTSGPFLAP